MSAKSKSYFDVIKSLLPAQPGWTVYIPDVGEEEIVAWALVDRMVNDPDYDKSELHSENVVVPLIVDGSEAETVINTGWTDEWYKCEIRPPRHSDE